MTVTTKGENETDGEDSPLAVARESTKPSGADLIDDLNGRRFALVPISPEYHRVLYQLSIADENSFRWRSQGGIPPFDVFERSLYTGVLSQFMIIPASSPRPTKEVLGLVLAYGANLANGYCYAGAFTDPIAGAGRVEAVGLLIRHLLRRFPLRKVYLETPEYNVYQYQSAVDAGVLKEEGRFKDHLFYFHRYWDLVTYAAYRSDLVEVGARLGLASPFDAIDGETL